MIKFIHESQLCIDNLTQLKQLNFYIQPSCDVYQIPNKASNYLVLPKDISGLDIDMINTLNILPKHIKCIIPEKIIYCYDNDGNRKLGFIIKNYFVDAIDNISSFPPWSEQNVKNLLVDILPMISILAQEGRSHGAINLKNIKINKRTGRYYLGLFYVDTFGKYQPYEYLPLNASNNTKHYKPIYDNKNDLYALGVLVVHLICGTNILHHSNIKLNISKRIAEGSYTALYKIISGLCSSDMLQLIHGLINDNETERWDCKITQNWLIQASLGKRNIDKIQMSLMPHRSPGKKNKKTARPYTAGEARKDNIQQQALYPFYFNNHIFNNCHTLGMEFAHHWNYTIANVLLIEDKMQSMIEWIKISCNNHVIHGNIQKFISQSRNNILQHYYYDVLLAVIIMEMTNNFPLVYKGHFINLEVFHYMIKGVLNDDIDAFHNVIWSNNNPDRYREYDNDEDDLSTYNNIMSFDKISKDSQIILEIMSTNIIEMWIKKQFDNTNAWRSKIKNLKHYFNNQNMLNNFYRCIYVLYKNESCKIYDNDILYITSLSALVNFIVEYIKEHGREKAESIIFSIKVLAFILEKSTVNNQNKEVLASIPSFNTSYDDMILAALTIFEAIEHDIDNNNKKVLYQFFNHHAEYVIDRCENPPLKIYLKNKHSMLQDSEVLTLSRLLNIVLIARGKKVDQVFRNAVEMFAKVELSLFALSEYSRCHEYSIIESGNIIQKIALMATVIPMLKALTVTLQ